MAVVVKNRRRSIDPNDPNVRMKFLKAWTKTEEPLDAVFDAFEGIETAKAFALAKELGSIDVLKRQREDLIRDTTSKKDGIATREEVAAEAWRRCCQSKNEEMAHKWMATFNLIMGYHTKPVDSKTTNPVPINKVMEVPVFRSDDEWEKELETQQKKLQEFNIDDEDTDSPSD